jgi:hypothetical protein
MYGIVNVKASTRHDAKSTAPPEVHAPTAVPRSVAKDKEE